MGADEHAHATWHKAVHSMGGGCRVRPRMTCSSTRSGPSTNDIEVQDKPTAVISDAGRHDSAACRRFPAARSNVSASKTSASKTHFCVRSQTPGMRATSIAPSVSRTVSVGICTASTTARGLAYLMGSVPTRLEARRAAARCARSVKRLVLVSIIARRRDCSASISISMDLRKILP